MQENPFTKSKKNYCTFLIVRHGETKLNVEGLVQGHSIDSPLTEEGIKQVKTVARTLSKMKFDLVYSSDLLRAVRTAEIIALEHRLAVQTSQLLRERKYGRFEGKPVELLKHFNKLFDLMTEDERVRHRVDKDAESDEELVTRFITFLRETAVIYPGKQILVVSHGGLMRVFLQHIGFWPDKYFSTSRIANAAYIKLLSDGIEFFVEETKGIKREGLKD